MTEGRDPARFAAVQFQEVGKPYHFSCEHLSSLAVGDFVVVTTSRGRELGQVVDFLDDVPDTQSGSIKPVERMATPRDLALRRMWQDKELEALINCREKAADLSIPRVKFARAEYSFDGSRLTFFYNSEGDEKVDLTKLVQRLRRSYRKTKIDMRQIGPRDVAKEFCGMGACSKPERCCCQFLTEFSPISIRMAKEQGISLNPQEITGMCGRLRCCLKYEFDLYKEARKGMPKRKKRVITPEGEGKVIDLNPLQNIVTVLLEGGRRVDFDKEDVQRITNPPAKKKD